MGRYEYGRRYRRRRLRRKIFHMLPVIVGCLAVAVACGFGIYTLTKKLTNGSGQEAGTLVQASPVSGAPGQTGAAPAGEELPSSDGADSSSQDESNTIALSPAASLLAQAESLAAGYDYDGAIALLQSDSQFASDPDVQQAIADYENIKSELVSVKLSEVTHVFFHSLIMDPSKAFDGEADQDGYNQVMTTAEEFKKILQFMYDKGYVLVRLHDMGYITVDESGKEVMKPGTILLPEGKHPFVMSQDDVCYYPYMTGDGFASRIVVGEDGKPACEMTLDDGTVSMGSYDLVPILEDFISEHPDFSYKGARAVIAFTGYEGILGYRTSSSYQDSPTYEQDRQEAARVAQCLRDNGWELASHSWGHLNLGTVEMDRFQTDTDKWEQEVESLIGPTDIILYPFGAEIGDWHPYTHENERFNYLFNAGFRYFCNVDSSQYWVQIGDDYLRQGRRNLDGYRMWKDITAESEGRTRKLSDLFQAEDVFDSSRPTPVPDM